MVYFTKYFRQYLLGRRFIIRTDHAALTWLQKTPDPIGQNARWLEQLGEFTFDIKHRSGTHHSNADALSRHPCLNKPSCTACHPKETSATTVQIATPPNRNIPGRYTGARPQRAPPPLRRPIFHRPPSPDRSPERASDTASRAGSPPPIRDGPGRHFGARPQRMPPSLRPQTLQSPPSPVRPPKRTPGTVPWARPLPTQVHARDNGSARRFQTPQQPRRLNPTARVFHPTRTQRFGTHSSLWVRERVRKYAGLLSPLSVSNSRPQRASQVVFQKTVKSTSKGGSFGPISWPARHRA